ncbi:hypothetical protein C8J56DRAFT_1056160 [Mycena floridula]|nr:hypothetical protein C8J56DRAFT_1056160 [Mycena floridula]
MSQASNQLQRPTWTLTVTFPLRIACLTGKTISKGTLKEIRDVIPPHLFVRDTVRGLLYLARDIRSDTIELLTPLGAEIARWAGRGVYWWFQGLIFTGIWVIGHECGHGAFSDHKILNDIIGFITYSFLWTPYFSWKISHHRHHSNHASMERDEVYVPKTRGDLGLPEEDDHTHLNYNELLGDTPLFTLFMLIRQQVLAFPAHPLFNVSEQKTYPKWTNHFDPFRVAIQCWTHWEEILVQSEASTRGRYN